ncbi:hypothetical protein FIBSPDRAFT_1055349 [Athelia psychrophila]|uniref:Uncharacterized protein n=2 Tax=Athelia psychrophila TaxID=1759441 RepID=A0A167TVW3_9AGAM|nr:hypothetical protein FIBSPDRAFT_1055349 [Fibularhizoctonia sp. CBS 109695]
MAREDMAHPAPPSLTKYRLQGCFEVLMATKDSFGYFFSDDLAVAELVSQAMPLAASFQVADGLVGSCGSVLQGQTR